MFRGLKSRKKVEPQKSHQDGRKTEDQTFKVILDKSVVGSKLQDSDKLKTNPTEPSENTTSGMEKQKYRKTQKVKVQNDQGDTVEIIKFTSELEADRSSSDSHEVHSQTEANATPSIETKSTYKNEINKNIFREDVKDVGDNSILAEFVKNLLKDSLPRKTKFDPQDLMYRIKKNYVLRNTTWETDFKLLTCKAQPFLQRMSLMGEFYN